MSVLAAPADTVVAAKIRSTPINVTADLATLVSTVRLVCTESHNFVHHAKLDSLFCQDIYIVLAGHILLAVYVGDILFVIIESQSGPIRAWPQC